MISPDSLLFILIIFDVVIEYKIFENKKKQIFNIFNYNRIFKHCLFEISIYKFV